MIIGVDAGCLGIKDERLKVGVYQMAVNFLQELGKIDTANTYFLYSFYPIEKDLIKKFGKNFRNVVVVPVRGWTKIWLPLQLLKDKPDIFVGLNQSLPLKLPLQTYKSIVVIHDALFEQFPKMYPGSFRKLHKETKSAAQLANAIVVPSEATKKDIQKYYKVENEKIIVIPEGVRKFNNYRLRSNNKDFVQARMTKSSLYLLYVGALKPQKNIPRLLKAFSSLSSKIHSNNNGVSLVIVGGDKWRDKEIDKTLVSLAREVQKRIAFLGVVDDGELAKLYKDAAAFVSPSLSEGFGLTFVEAMSFGTPVIGPNTGSIPDMVGDAGILVDSTNIQEITKAMQKMLNPKMRLEYSKKSLSQVQKFSWQKFAKEFLDAICSI